MRNMQHTISITSPAVFELTTAPAGGGHAPIGTSSTIPKSVLSALQAGNTVVTPSVHSALQITTYIQ